MSTKITRIIISWLLSLWAIACYAGLIIAIMSLVSCTTTRTVTVPEYHTIVAHQHDTLNLKDSVYVHDSVSVAMQGDTLRIERFNIVYRDRWRDRVHSDTLLKTDTITVVQHVEKPPNAWQRFSDGMAYILLPVLCILDAILFLPYLRHRRP